MEEDFVMVVHRLSGVVRRLKDSKQKADGQFY